MTEKWHAEVTNDPTRDFELCIEIYENTRHRATVRRDASGLLTLVWFSKVDDAIVEVPAKWLQEILDRADRDLPIHEL
jgi:hypothetical protein